jgi:hypothetical protein
MTSSTLVRLLGIAALALALGAVALAGASAPTQTGHAAAVAKITPTGVDGVKLGMNYRTLRRRNLIGHIRRGCELGGPNTRSANLKLPLRGTVNFTQTKPRLVTDITIRRGARARGVGRGDTIAEIKAAFPKAKVDHSTDEVFQLTLVKIPKNGGGPLRFAVSTITKRVTLIGVPFIAFCE